MTIKALERLIEFLKTDGMPVEAQFDFIADTFSAKVRIKEGNKEGKIVVSGDGIEMYKELTTKEGL